MTKESAKKSKAFDAFQKGKGGEVICEVPKFGYFTAGKVYEIGEVNLDVNGDVIKLVIRDDDADRYYIDRADFLYRWNKVYYDETDLSPQDYETMFELALMTKDEDWFNELHALAYTTAGDVGESNG